MRWPKTAATLGILRGHTPRVPRRGWRGAVPREAGDREAEELALDGPATAVSGGADRWSASM